MKKEYFIIVLLVVMVVALLGLHFLEEGKTSDNGPEEEQMRVGQPAATEPDGMTYATNAQNKPLKPGDDLSEVLAFLQQYKTGFLATVDNGKPRVRAFGMMKLEAETLFFSTSNSKAVFKQLKRQPLAEWIVMEQKTMKTLRILGAVTFIKDQQKMEKFYEEYPILKRMYANRPGELEIFSMDIKEANWFGFGRAPQKKENGSN